VNDNETVRTTQGELRGKRLALGLLFAGIPYAAPPTGDLRFRPPSTAPRWEGVRNAPRPDASAMQQVDSPLDLPTMRERLC
jgi:para-nitrobenzyl esterase